MSRTRKQLRSFAVAMLICIALTACGGTATTSAATPVAPIFIATPVIPTPFPTAIPAVDPITPAPTVPVSVGEYSDECSSSPSNNDLIWVQLYGIRQEVKFLGVVNELIQGVKYERIFREESWEEGRTSVWGGIVDERILLGCHVGQRAIPQVNMVYQPAGIYRVYLNYQYSYYQVAQEIIRIPNEIGMSYDDDPPNPALLGAYPSLIWK